MRKFRIMLDQEQFRTKPSRPSVINNRIIKNETEVSIFSLLEFISSGQSFIPAVLKPINGVYKRSNKNWHSQDIICLDFDEGMTIEEAKIIFKDSGNFIYKTFSHSEDNNKFRVVFLLNRTLTKVDEFDYVIKYLMNLYPQADESCKDASRIFYGSNSNPIVLDINNLLDIDSILLNRSIDITTNIEEIIKTPPLEVSTLITNIRGVLIESRKIQTFSHIDPVYEELYKKDLREFMTSIVKEADFNMFYEKSFRCIFHQDSKPSASIFQEEKTGAWLYKCHSSKNNPAPEKRCGFIGNIVRVTQKLLNLNRVASFHFLCEYYGYKVEESDWQKKTKETLDHNISFLGGNQFPLEYPVLYGKIRRYIPLLIMLNMISKQYLGSDKLKQIEKNIFFATRKQLSDSSKVFEILIGEGFEDLEYKKITADMQEIGKRIDLFSLLGLIEKIHIDDLPEDMREGALKIKNTVRTVEKANKEVVQYNTKYFTNYYKLDEYDDNVLSNADDITFLLKNNNVSMTGLNRESIIRNVGEEFANKVYPMRTEEVVSDFRIEISNKIKKMFLDIIEEKGFVRESDVLNLLIKENFDKNQKKGKNKHLKNIKRNINELIKTNNLQKERVSKDTRDKLTQFDLSSVGKNSFIIFRKQDKLEEI